MKPESFDAAHRGRCPGCDMFDGGSHIAHRTEDFHIGWYCYRHGSWSKPTTKKSVTYTNMKTELYEVAASPDANCKDCVRSLKSVARYQKILAGVAL